MNTLQMLKRLKALKRDLNRIGRQVLADNDPEFVALLHEQMRVGKDKNNELIGSYRSVPYGELKLRMNPAADGNVDLRYKGGYWNGIYIRLEGNNKYKVMSSDAKARLLEEMYGTAHLGLNPENTEKFRREYFMPGLRMGVRRYLND